MATKTKPISIRIPKELEIEVKKFKPPYVSYSAFLVELIVRGLESEKYKSNQKTSRHETMSFQLEQLNERVEILEKSIILDQLEQLKERVEKLEKKYN